MTLSTPPRPDAAPAPERLEIPRRVVVVGAGLAATQTVGALREAGFDGHVTVLGAEGRAPYDRPPLSKHLLDRPAPTPLAQELGVDLEVLADEVHLADPATSLQIAPDGVTVRTAARTVSADVAVIATGARARRVPGWEHALVLHTADDAEALRARVRPGARLVVIGAGWIGAEVAGVAAAAGADVTVVEATSAPLSGALGAGVGAHLRPWFAAAGVGLLTNTQVVGLDASAVHLGDGTSLPADVVLAAVGAAPATGWLDGTLPRDRDGSLRVDEHYAVLGASGRVRAVGDVARRRSHRHSWVPGGHWDGALRGPVTLAAHLVDPTGAHEPAETDGAHDPVPYVFSTQLGHDVTLFGLPDDADDVVLRGDPAGPDGWSALWFRADQPILTAVLTVDRPRDVGAARRLFAGRDLPRLDRGRASDLGTALRAAQLP